MSKKHYILLAAKIHALQLDKATTIKIAQAVGDVCQLDNINFKWDTFINACINGVK